MKIVAMYDFNGGKNYIKKYYSKELGEIKKIIGKIKASNYKTKRSKEKTMSGKMLYSPFQLNGAFKSEFEILNWSHHKIECKYEFGEYLKNYIPPAQPKTSPFRDMDFVKKDKKIGVEVQFGKYSFMVYNVCAKMTIFKNLNIIDSGVEIVPVKHFVDQMSTGVSYFEQFAWDLEKRGKSNIDIPVLILGIDS